MAKHVKFDEATHVLPANPDDGQLLEDGTVIYPDGTRVEPLHVMRSDREQVSCWELSEAEIAHIIHTKRVYLYVYGGLHPPVYISGLPVSRAEEVAATIDAAVMFPQAESNPLMVGPDTPQEE